MNEFVVYSRSFYAKYVNIYKEKDDYYELHITDEKDVDVCILLDKEDVDKVKTYFWSFSYTDVNKTSISVRTYIGKKYTTMKSVIMNDYINDIVPLNRNQCDFRKSNLYIGDDIYGTTERMQLINKYLPNNIRYSKGKNGNIYGCKLVIRENNKRKEIYFGIRKYKTVENCVNAAIQYSGNKKHLIFRKEW